MNCCDSGKRFSSQRFDFLAQRDGGSYDPGLEYSSVFSRRSWWRTATREIALKFIVEGEKGLVLLECGADEKEIDGPWTVVGLTAKSVPLLMSLHCAASS
ncbi:hypothetical protein GQ55_9G495300 [Panicum hallii var. hallii]|uniref:Uncharacterized protein n=1 Tax=Panicum hallii var. hallii TaxID=1504633 RepID=A0A2T7CDA9_9POAL|nr:hypothetical protein GQ55_9G495300 [Panicum hallii var. hallii]